MRMRHPRLWSRREWLLATLASAVGYAIAFIPFGAEIAPRWIWPAAAIGAGVGVIWMLLVRSIFGRRRERD